MSRLKAHPAQNNWTKLPRPLAVPCRREPKQPMSNTLLQIWTPPPLRLQGTRFSWQSQSLPALSCPLQSWSALCQGAMLPKLCVPWGPLKGETPPARPSDPRFLFPLPSPHSAHPSSYPLFSGDSLTLF
jgi:hypothetical protein